MIATRLLRIAHCESPGAGMLGWTASHVHANMVERQLHSILYTDRVSNLSSSRMKMDCGWFLGRVCGGWKSFGRARVFQGPEKKQKYSRMRKIMVWTITAAKIRLTCKFGKLSEVQPWGWWLSYGIPYHEESLERNEHLHLINEKEFAYSNIKTGNVTSRCHSLAPLFSHWQPEAGVKHAANQPPNFSFSSIP